MNQVIAGDWDDDDKKKDGVAVEDYSDFDTSASYLDD